MPSGRQLFAWRRFDQLDAMVFELNGVGRIRRLRPHLRPLLAIVVFGAMLGPKLARRLGVVRRALSHR